jgi:hypothetical protein
MSSSTRQPRILVAALAAMIAFSAGCGGGGDESSTSTTTTTTSASASGGGDVVTAGLTSYLPTDATLLAVVDVARAREELGLPPDADAADVAALGSEGLEAPGSQLVLAAALGATPLAVAALSGAPDPVAAALDGGAIEAAASNQGDPEGPVAVIRTRQSFDDLASKLADAGWERDGETITNTDEERVSEITGAGDGVIVFSGSGASAKELVASPPGGPKAMAALLAGDGPSVGLATMIPESQGGCLRVFGGRETADNTEGVMRFELDGAADPGAVDLSGLEESGIKVGKAEVAGDVVEVPFTADLGAGTNPINQVLADFAFTDFYECG